MRVRSARLRSLAKVNLGLKVLNKRPDGYHELRTVFQTISLADTIDIEYSPARATSIEIDSTVDIPDNLIVRAAQIVLSHLATTARVRFRLTKKIPMGGGLGGGSSNAAAVLLALPVLAGRRIPLDQLIALAAQLGSDVPFFLLGGRALGLGRGTELYPLPDNWRGGPALVVTPRTHVSTANAYSALNRQLTNELPSSILNSFQSFVWRMEDLLSPDFLAGDWTYENDFESAVFLEHPHLGEIKAKLVKLRAKNASMSGSGSAVFGIFETREQRDRALRAFGEAYPVSLVSRRAYHSLWWRQLDKHMDQKTWPPLSRYGE